MVQDIWINLYSRDLEKTKDFFKAIGFQFNDKFSNSGMVSFAVPGKTNIMICFFPPDHLAKFIGNSLTDTTISNEALFSLGVDSKEEVDSLAKTVLDNGGSIFSKPTDVDGWMYNCGFADPDGHKWNFLYMDFEKMPT